MDMISRQSAIDMIRLYREDEAVDLDELESSIAMMPSVQPEPIKINIDHELTKDEYEKLLKDMADAPIVLLPSAQPEIIACGEGELTTQPEIIRCKDCKHWGKKGLCGKWDQYISNGDFYCGCAELKGEQP